MKKIPTSKLIPIHAIDDMEQIIEFGFELFYSIKNANWNYNNKNGLPHQTAHMEKACENWISLMKQFNRHLHPSKSSEKVKKEEPHEPKQ
jgi:hypothetical protein